VTPAKRPSSVIATQRGFLKKGYSIVIALPVTASKRVTVSAAPPLATRPLVAHAMPEGSSTAQATMPTTTIARHFGQTRFTHHDMGLSFTNLSLLPRTR
jgi:hypothetical protein